MRIYLEDGESVTTDQYGRFTFPSVHPGQHVLRIDASTLPPACGRSTTAATTARKSMQRLVHGLYDSGLDAGRQLRAGARSMMIRARIRRAGVALVIAGMFLSTVDVNPAGEIPGALAADEARPRRRRVAAGAATSARACRRRRSPPRRSRSSRTPRVAAPPPKAPEAADLTHLTFTATGGLSASLVAPADDARRAGDDDQRRGRNRSRRRRRAQVGDTVVPFSRIGKRAVDNKTGATRYTYYGVVLAPGPERGLAHAARRRGRARRDERHRVYGPGRPATLAVAARGPLRADGARATRSLHLDGVRPLGTSRRRRQRRAAHR